MYFAKKLSLNLKFALLIARDPLYATGVIVHGCAEGSLRGRHRLLPHQRVGDGPEGEAGVGADAHGLPLPAGNPNPNPNSNPNRMVYPFLQVLAVYGYLTVCCPVAAQTVCSVHCLLPTVCCLLPAAYCLLPAAYCLLPTACCLLSGLGADAHGRPLSAGCVASLSAHPSISFPTAHCPLPAACRG
jgi:hypothetical protein